MNKKYELVKEDCIEFNGRTLYRIRALKNFRTMHGIMINTGDLGGYIQSEKNLSQEGNCWVFDNAKVFDNACVYDDAKVYSNACVCDDAKVFDYAKVCDSAFVSGHARVFENAYVYGDAWVYNDAKVCSYAKVGNNADICNSADYVCIKGLGTACRAVTFYKCKDNYIRVTCDCFNGTLDDFVAKVKQTHKDSKYAREYLTIIEAVKIHFSFDKNSLNKTHLRQ